MTVDIAFIGNKIDRQSEKRTDEALKNALQHNPKFIVLSAGQVIYQTMGANFTIYHDKVVAERFQPDWADACLLGTENGQPVIALPVLLNDGNLPAPYHQATIREVYTNGLFETSETGALSQAYSLLTWHQNNHYCARCGHQSHLSGGGVKRLCPNCQAQHFPRTDPVAIMLVHFEDKCLLGRTPQFEKGRYSCLAGFIEQGETLEVAVRRESREEMGVDVGQVTYIASQPWPFPHSLMLGCHAEALSADITIDYDEMEDGRWFTRTELNDMLQGSHQSGFHLPPEGAIAHYLIQQWLGKV